MPMAADPFVEYYESQSASPAATQHFVRLRDLLLRIRGDAVGGRVLQIADIGCGAGTFSRLWTEAGCRVNGLDVNPALIRIARQRAAADGMEIEFSVGSAESLPWPDGKFDIVVMPELLEHVPNWRECLSEAARVLRQEGILHVSTTNRLCPVQQEFDLPAYSWYPGWLKQRCLERARTTRREWVHHAEYPAVNWFDPYSLAAEFRRLALQPMDRFEIFACYGDDSRKRGVGRLATTLAPVRFVGHVLTPSSTIVGRKQ
jgi:2-polyprenyl-6-hydroxyphenyl methylase/3-demethylubiquinone-9 3-methyltransferase